MLFDARTDRVALTCDRLPLATYREIAAHLRALGGIEVELLPQTATTFDYLQSQVGGIALSFSDPPSEAPSGNLTDGSDRDRAAQILSHYAGRFGPWQRLDVATTAP